LSTFLEAFLYTQKGFKKIAKNSDGYSLFRFNAEKQSKLFHETLKSDTTLLGYDQKP
jgi:hypothetical protein